jgi:Tol biopolymer transport system component
LEHPHICSVYDVGEQDGTSYLVMQLLEGETLATRLVTGALPLDEALRYAIEIAGALDRAHRAGIIHRDLKPANIMLTRTGAKLLDFGLAKSAAPAVSVTGLSMLPTTPPGLTARGTMLGTFQYMAPEQLEGQQADARTDIFAFGAMLYEMITGRKAFQGKSPVSLIGAILKDQPPPISDPQPLAPPALDRVVRTCLAKDPDERWQSASDLQRELKWLAEEQPDTRPSGPLPRAARARVGLIWLAASIALSTVVGLLVVFLLRTPSQTTAAIRFEISPPAGTRFGGGPANPHPAVSPDGRRVAFTVVDASNRGVIAVRKLGDEQAHVVPGTQGIRLGSGTGNGLPFWSPDSRFIGFFADGALKKVDVTGGPAQTLCRVSTGEGGAWNGDGTIVFAPDLKGGLFRVSDAGGTPIPVTKLDEARNEQSHRFPWFLPDGRHFLYLAMPNTTLFIGSLDSPQREELFAVQSKAVYADGHLLFMRSGSLLAQPFDTTRLRVTGEAFPIAEDVGVNIAMARAAFSVSSNGVLTYRALPTVASTQLTWVDRSGIPNGVVGEPAIQRVPQLSPDGKRVSVNVLDPSTNRNDVWIWEVARGVRTRFTFDEADEVGALWSPNGDRLIFNSRRSDQSFSMFQKTSSGVAGAQAVLPDDTRSSFATSWSRDGRFILFDTMSGSLRGDLWVVALEGDRKPIQLTQTPFDEGNARFSPDGLWIAYQSNESGQDEIYAMTFVPDQTASPPAIQPSRGSVVSKDGGIQPRWRRDGKELFYLSGDGLMAVPVNGQGSALEFGTAQRLFEIDTSSQLGRGYDVSADGQRFLINKLVDDDRRLTMTVVVNWTAGLSRR